MPTPLPDRAGRRCLAALNALHSTIYFAPDLEKELSSYGIKDSMGAYLAGRAAALGEVAAGTVTACFYGFSHEMVARHLPAAWELVRPRTVLELRLGAADAVLRRYLGEDAIASREMAEAAELALRACEACTRPGHPMYAALADQPVPQAPHLALWFAASLLREHRGDNHIAALVNAGIGGLESLVSHSASSDGMPKELVMSKRGWTEADWRAAEERLRDRGLMDAAGALTAAGVRMREELEAETDRLDAAPYEHLGAAHTARLTELAGAFTTRAAVAGAFPAELLQIFARG